MKKLLIATRNEGKFKEIREILEPLDFDFCSLNDFKDMPETEEDRDSFKDNAIKKAYEAAKFTGILSLADDSGLEVEALDGKPGIYSSRFSGPDANDEKNIQKLIKILKDLPINKRDARFQCWTALVSKDKILGTTSGICRGKIILTPRGKHGFGYDPVFIPEGHDKTFAELGSEVKDKISHRAKAFFKMKELILKLIQSKSL